MAPLLVEDRLTFSTLGFFRGPGSDNEARLPGGARAILPQM